VKFGDTTTASLITRSFPPEVLNLSEEELNEVYTLGKRKRETGTQSGGAETRPRKTSTKPTESNKSGSRGRLISDGLSNAYTKVAPKKDS
jgi:hypothetical protein